MMLLRYQRLHQLHMPASDRLSGSPASVYRLSIGVACRRLFGMLQPGPLKHQERHDADATSYEREFGVRVGKLGQGFFI